jgi:hypothetical protein
MTLASCGSLKLSPEGCESNGLWGERSVDAKLEEEDEFVYSQEYSVWIEDLTVSLQDFLMDRGIECHDVKKLRVQMKSVFFVKRELTVFIKK